MRLKARATGMEPTRPATTNRVRFGRLHFNTGTRRVALDRIGEWAEAPNRSGLMVGFINPHVYNCAVAEPDVADFLEECDFVCVDGVGVTVAARLLHRLKLSRVVATDLLDDFVGLERPLNALLVGTTTAEVLAAADKINAGAPGIRVVEAVDGFR
jgi:N-acetylglucosaminyldiphosphoundecaprenol N-acetyl-beta-D-mannosaminyltransferase